MIRAILLVALLAEVGCAAWRGADADREYREAQKDHAQCASDTVAFPAPEYVACRRKLADARQRDQWLELSMAQQLERGRTPEYLNPAPPAPYRPIDAQRFVCEERSRDGATWIACGER
jgi:hypothetical protein